MTRRASPPPLPSRRSTVLADPRNPSFLLLPLSNCRNPKFLLLLRLRRSFDSGNLWLFVVFWEFREIEEGIPGTRVRVSIRVSESFSLVLPPSIQEIGGSLDGGNRSKRGDSAGFEEIEEILVVDDEIAERLHVRVRGWGEIRDGFNWHQMKWRIERRARV